MRTALATLTAGLLLAALPASGQEERQTPYRLELHSTESRSVVQDGRNVRLVTVKFTITRRGQHADDVGKDYKILIFEENREVRRVDVPKAQVSEELSVILALDISGSMGEHGRMEQARRAAIAFFNQLPRRAEAGLILFDHEMRVVEPLTPKREGLLEHVRQAQPLGGTAYLDATAKGIDMLAGVKGKEKAVVVMTDGVDMNSTHTLADVVKKARAAGVRVYPIGIGEPGRQEPVTSVLALDRSESMLSPADDNDKISKLEALKRAATRFLTFVRETEPATVRTTILQFSDTPEVPEAFTNNRQALRAIIHGLKGKGETCVLDATYEAVAALEAERPRGKKAVIALTDGIDNTSRRRVEEVIDRAKQAKVTLYMLGFGRPGELDEGVMKRMAAETGGRYYHAKDQKSLLQIFENLSIQLHDDGIDEVTLKELARGTGGQYYPAKDVSQLQLILKGVTQDIQRKEYEITFPSRFQELAGLRRDVQLKLVRLDGSVAGGSEVEGGSGGYTVVGETEGKYQVYGLVPPEANLLVYLGMLGLLGLLLVLPAGLRHLTRSAS